MGDTGFAISPFVMPTPKSLQPVSLKLLMVVASIMITGSLSYSQSDGYGTVGALDLSCIYLDYLGEVIFHSTFKWKFCQQRSCCAEGITAIFIRLKKNSLGN